MNPAEQPEAPIQLDRWFRSSCSGLWYNNPKAEGEVNAVRLDGQIIERMDGELTLPWIHRVADWASDIYRKNQTLT